MLNQPISPVCLPSSSPARREKKMEVSWDAVRAGKTSGKRQDGGGVGGGGWRLLSGMAVSSRDLSTCPSPTFRNIPALQQTKHGERARNWPPLCLSTADLSDRTCKGPKVTCASHAKTQEKHMRDQVRALFHTATSSRGLLKSSSSFCWILGLWIAGSLAWGIEEGTNGRTDSHWLSQNSEEQQTVKSHFGRDRAKSVLNLRRCYKDRNRRSRPIFDANRIKHTACAVDYNSLGYLWVRLIVLDKKKKSLALLPTALCTIASERRDQNSCSPLFPHAKRIKLWTQKKAAHGVKPESCSNNSGTFTLKRNYETFLQ